jgi:hypothetical protein
VQRSVKVEAPADMEAARPVEPERSKPNIEAGNAAKGFADFHGLPLGI